MVKVLDVRAVILVTLVMAARCCVAGGWAVPLIFVRTAWTKLQRTGERPPYWYVFSSALMRGYNGEVSGVRALTSPKTRLASWMSDPAIPTT